MGSNPIGRTTYTNTDIVTLIQIQTNKGRIEMNTLMKALQALRFLSYMVVVTLPLTLALAWGFNTLSPDMQMFAYILSSTLLLMPMIVSGYERLINLSSSNEE